MRVRPADKFVLAVNLIPSFFLGKDFEEETDKYIDI